MSREHLQSWTKKDFDLQWFSGSGAGGQHRNKHQNCLRLVHKDTGITVISQNSRERSRNLKDALERMAPLLVDHYHPKEQKERTQETKVIRTYNIVENRVTDHETGKKVSYKNFDIGEFI